MYKLDDDIVALATVPGKSALNVVRVSGQTTKKLYTKITKQTGAPRANYCALKYLFAYKEIDPFDRAMVVYYKAPKSFTGEDSLEFSVHGGVLIARKLIDTLIKHGARQALPGEFSYRAFINNKIDLLQAEAISSIVDANNLIDSYYSLNSLKGSLSRALEKCKDSLQTLMMVGEHELDFNEGEIKHTKSKDFVKILEEISENISQITKTSYTQESEESNIRVAIVGKPNAGKSSLFNIMIGRARSIVTDEKGTTRDTIEIGLYLGSTPIILVDTAGIRRGRNEAEIMGVKKTLEEIKRASIVIVVDETNPINIIIKTPIDDKKTILVQNKIDLKKKTTEKGVLHLSCKKGRGINALLTRLSTMIKSDCNNFSNTYTFLINSRQKLLLNKIEVGINKTIRSYKKTNDLAICLSCLYGVVSHFDELIKPSYKNELLNKIFMGFCIGK